MLTIDVADPKNLNTAAILNKVGKSVVAQVPCTLIPKLGNILTNEDSLGIIAGYFLKTVENSIGYYACIAYRV